MRFFKCSVALLLICHTCIGLAKEQFYELTIDYKTVNYTGEPVEAMVINNQLPGPVLEFTEGDIAVIKVNNRLNTEASIHWHGLLLPQDQDGVPYLTYLPIKAGESFTYRFPVTHAGTYWYHSHTNIDEQRGQYGSIVIHPKQANHIDYDHDVVVQLSDWTNEDPKQILANLKKDGDWYALKKDSVVSLAGYAKRNALSAWITNRWQRMEGMDVSDVAYDAFLANGKIQLKLLPTAKAGDVARLRFINSAASSYFRLEQQQTPFTVIAADGIDVQAVTVESILMGMAETYDVLVTIPESGALEINANNIDGTGRASIIVGSGKYTPAPLPSRPNLYAAMNHSMHDMDMDMDMDSMTHKHHGHHKMHGMNHSAHDMTGYRKSDLRYSQLKTVKAVKHRGPLRVVKLDLTGDMESYNWSFNNKTLSKADAIKIDRGDVVQFVFTNMTMMHHPLHLHGHFFKVISGNGEHDVLKHTVDVPPMQRVTIEFAANEEKDWFFHCHNLYHAKTGMARVIRYSDYPGNPEFVEAKQQSNEIQDTDWYTRTDLKLYNNFIHGALRLSNFQYILEFDAERADWQENKTHLTAAYKLNRWTNLFIGHEYESEDGSEYQFGINYHAPFSIDLRFWISHELDLNALLGSEFQLTKHISTEFKIDTEDDWSFDLSYKNSPNISWEVGIRDNTDWGLGMHLTF